MMRPTSLLERHRSAAWGLLWALSLAACAGAPPAEDPGPRTVQPGAPGEPSRVLEPGERTAEQPRHTDADIRFMQAMIVHHEQALEMSALVPARAEHPGMLPLARRIEVSQASEIALMERWLAQRGQSPIREDDHVHDARHDGRDAGTAGMLSPEEMERLRGAEGAEFDRLFLDLMIRHHEGALVMVDELLSTPGAAQGAEIFQLAAHVEADQTAEIARMRAMRAALD